MQKKSLLLALFLGFFCSSFAQFTDQFSISFGSSVWHEWLPEDVHYIPTAMLGAFPLWRHKNFYIYSEGQLTYAINQVSFKSEYEFGTNMGIAYRLPLADWFQIGAMIGSGPHFITIDTRRQAKGFIFSDNFELNFNLNINKINTAIQLKTRYRHISNAGLKKPNGGIDNLIILIGLRKELTRSSDPIVVGMENQSSSK